MIADEPLFIVNPMSGGGRTKGRLPRLRDALRRNGFAPEIAETTHVWAGYDLARKAIAEGRETLIACGGDGTVYEVANAILDLGAADRVRLGTIPMGTGKDVGKCLGIGRPAAALRAIVAGRERRLDVGRVECRDEAGEPRVRHFLLEMSAGWIPEIAHSVPRRLKLLGDTAPYIITTIAKMAGPMSRPFDVEIDGRAYHAEYNSVTVHNMEYWGGDLQAVPGASPCDGLLDAVRWSPMARTKVVKVLQGQRNGGTHLELDGIDHHPSRNISLDSPKRTEIDLDGELGGYLPAKVEVVPAAIRFIAPATD